MRKRFVGISMVFALLLAASFSDAQPPGGKGGGGGKGGRGVSADPDAAVARMFAAFDANADGKLTRDEVTDERLKDLFGRADTKKAGVITKEELKALFVKEAAASGGGKGGAGKGGFGGKGGDGGMGRAGPAGGFAPLPPVQILPDFVRDSLGLSDEQKKRLAELQKAVDDGLAKILTAEQIEKLKEPLGFGRPPKD